MKRGAMRAAAAIGVALAAMLLVFAARSAQAASKKGTVKLAAEDLGLEIELVDKRVITVAPNKGTVLPAGTYSVKSFCLLAKKNGTVWKLKCKSPPDNLASLTVTEDETTTLDVGPPLVIKTMTGQLPPRSGRGILINMVIQGKSGEYYSPAVLAGTQEVPPPRFEIVGESGKTLQAGTWSTAEAAPAGTRGEYPTDSKASTG